MTTRRMNISNKKVVEKLEAVVFYLNEAEESISYNEVNELSQDVRELDRLNNNIEKLCGDLLEMTGKDFDTLINNKRVLGLKNKMMLSKEYFRIVFERAKREVEEDFTEVFEVETTEIELEYVDGSHVKEVYIVGKRVDMIINGKSIGTDNCDLMARLETIRDGIANGKYTKVEVLEKIRGVPTIDLTASVTGDDTLESLIICQETGKPTREFHKPENNVEYIRIFERTKEKGYTRATAMKQLLNSTISCLKAGDIRGFRYTIKG